MTDFNSQFHRDPNWQEDRCTICPYIIWAIVALVFVVTVAWGGK